MNATSRHAARNGERAGYVAFGYQPWDNDDEREFFIDNFCSSVRAGYESGNAWERACDELVRFRYYLAKLALCDTPVYSFPQVKQAAVSNDPLHRYVQTQLRNFTERGVVRLFYKCEMSGPWVMYGDVVLANAV